MNKRTQSTLSLHDQLNTILHEIETLLTLLISSDAIESDLAIDVGALILMLIRKTQDAQETACELFEATNPKE